MHKKKRIKNIKKKYSPITISTFGGALIGLLAGLVFSILYLSRFYKVKYVFIYMKETLFIWSGLSCLAGAVIGLAVGAILVSGIIAKMKSK